MGLGLETAREQKTPGGCRVRDDPSEEPLSSEAAKCYQAVVARGNYLAMDRPEMLFASKTCSTAVSDPGKDDLTSLKRIGRYLKGSGRLVWVYEVQDEPNGLDVYTDADCGGCRRTRRSTSGGIIMHGRHAIQAWSSTQKCEFVQL